MSNINHHEIINSWPSNLDGHLHYCIGLSGGIDSVVLLHLFHQIAQHKPIKLSAIHVNHGISTNANLWTNFCQELCDGLNITLYTSYVKFQKIGGEGLENSARKLRYQEYTKSAADVIVLAHHQDDQVETMLSQIMRGSNIHNSAGMLATMTKQNKHYWRPLLNYSKEDIYSYSLKHNLSNVEDESNQDNHYLRNFLRNQIIPQLVNFDQHIKTKLLQSIHQLQKTNALIDEIAELDFNQLSNNLNQSINRIKFTNLSLLRQENVLVHYIAKHNLPLPSQKKLQEFIRQINTARLDRHPQINLSNNSKIIATTGEIQINSIIK